MLIKKSKNKDLVLMNKRYRIVYKVYNARGLVVEVKAKNVWFRSNYEDGIAILIGDGWKLKNRLSAEKLVFAKYDGKKIKHKLVYTIGKL